MITAHIPSGYVLAKSAGWSGWVISFVLHWSFVLEMCVWAAAATPYLRRQADAR